VTVADELLCARMPRSPIARRRPARRCLAARLRSAAAALIAVGALGCPSTRPPSPECVAYLKCYFPRGTTYPQGQLIDGGVDQNGEPIELSFDSFSDPALQQTVRDAYEEGGRCWRIDSPDAIELGNGCTRACKQALVEECERPVTLCPDVLVDGVFVVESGPQLTCADLLGVEG